MLIHVKEAAERKGLSIGCLSSLARSNKITAEKISGVWFVEENELPNIKAKPRRARGSVTVAAIVSEQSQVGRGSDKDINFTLPRAQRITVTRVEGYPADVSNYMREIQPIY